MRGTIRDSIRSIRRIFQFLKGNSVLYTAGLFMVSSFYLLSGLFEGQIYRLVASIGVYGNARIFQQFCVISALLAGIILLRSFGQVLYLKAVARADESLRRQLAEQLLCMPLSSWRKRHSGDWMAVLGKDTDDATDTYKDKACRFMGCILQTVGGVVIIAWVSPFMAALGICTGLCYMWVGILKWKRMRVVQQGLRKAGGEMASQLSNEINGAWISRFYHFQPILSRKLSEALHLAYDNGRKGMHISSCNGALIQIGYTLSYSGTLLVGLLLVHMGYLNLPDMLAVWPLSMQISYGLRQAGFLFTEFQETSAAVERLEEAFDLPHEELEEGTLLSERNDAPAIEIEQLTFSYDGEQPVLKEVSLTVQQGEKIAFVGESGSGKTTLMKLLMGFYQVKEGRISIFGQPVINQPLSWVRSQFSYVPQMPHLLDDTIDTNIALVKHGCTKEEVIGAAQKAGADDFICELPEKYETSAGENGSRLSGGQCQRIAVARAFLKDAPIFIFDEATAALDGRSEAQLQNTLKHMDRDKTLLFITHRISTAVFADRIVVMNQGRIVEVGSHQKLLEKGGYYKELWERTGIQEFD